MNLASKGIPEPDKTIGVDVRLHQDKVVMHFTAKIDNLKSGPQQAVDLAKALLTGAQMLDPKSTEGITWQTTH